MTIDQLYSGGFSATGTVERGRINIFDMRSGHERHIGTFVAAKVSQTRDELERDIQAMLDGLSAEFERSAP